MEQLEEQKIKRVLIELDDGTTFYDGKPDLICFIIENKYGEKLDCKGGSFVKKEVITSKIISHTLDELGNIQSMIAFLGLLQLAKEAEHETKIND